MNQSEEDQRAVIDEEHLITRRLTGAMIIKATAKKYFEGDIELTCWKDGKQFIVEISACGDDMAHITSQVREVT